MKARSFHLIAAALQMDAINIDAIKVAEEWLQLDFAKARTEAIPNRAITAREVWNNEGGGAQEKLPTHHCRDRQEA